MEDGAFVCLRRRVELRAELMLERGRRTIGGTVTAWRRREKKAASKLLLFLRLVGALWLAWVAFSEGGGTLRVRDCVCVCVCVYLKHGFLVDCTLVGVIIIPISIPVRTACAKRTGWVQAWNADDMPTKAILPE